MSGLLPTLRSMCEEIKKCCLPETELEAFSGKRIVPRCSGVLKEKRRETMLHTAVIACVSSWLQQHLFQSKRNKNWTRKKSGMWHSSAGSTGCCPATIYSVCNWSDQCARSLQVNGSLIEFLQNIFSVEKLFLVPRRSFQMESYAGSTVLEISLKPSTTMAFMPQLHICHWKTTQCHKYWRKQRNVIAAGLLIKCQRIRKRSVHPSSACSLSNADTQYYACVVASVPTYSM